jgi:uncharacterized protein (UPF0335 family)
MVKTKLRRYLTETEITRKEVTLFKKDRSPIAGAGIMLLNSQIKKRLPQISIDDRSKLAVDVWSKMTDDEREDLRSEGYKGWICDPRRKEITSCPEPLDTYTSNALHRVTFQKSISLVELPPTGQFKTVLLNLQTDSNRTSDNPPISLSSRDNLQTIARAFAEEVSTLSADIPEIYQAASMATIDSKERIAVVVKKMQKRRERLRAYAAESSYKSRTTGDVIGSCITQIEKDNRS